MFCQKCGSEVAQGAKFCTNCGAPAADQPQTVSQNQPKQKKKPNLLLILIVVGICFIIGRTMGESMGESMSGSSSSGGQSGQSSYSDPTLAASGGGEYTKIFADRNIVTAPAFFGTLKSAAYAIVDSDGYIDHLQFGYEGDTIVQMVETVYMPVDGWTDAEKADFDTNCRAAYAEAEALDCVSISYNIGYSYYSITVTIQDLDQAENVQSAVDAGLLSMTDGSASVMSMAASDASLLEQGYAKK